MPSLFVIALLVCVLTKAFRNTHLVMSWVIVKTIYRTSPPSMKEFLYICDYFGITPRQFFDEEIANPILVQKALDSMKAMKDKDLLTLIGLIDRLNEQAVGTPLDSPAK